MFDLTKIKPVETMVIAFRDKEGTAYVDEQGQEIGVLVIGPTNPAHIKAREKMFRNINANAEKPKNQQNKKCAEEQGTEFLRSVITQPSGFQIRDLTGDAAINAFLTEDDWKLYVDQVLGYLLDTRNFLQSA